MKKINNIKRAGGVLAVTGVGLLTLTGVNAQSNDIASQNTFFQNIKNKVQNFKNDFAQNLTAEQKQVLEEAKKLREAGKNDEAKALLDKAGLRPKMHGGKMGEGRGDHGNRKQIEEAIVANNFANFQQVASTSPLKNISQDTYNQLVPQFQARKAADEKIREILKNAGIEAPSRPGEAK